MADTLYVDFARHTETPVATLKGLFKYWFAKASWHRPSVLVFDNMDKLLGTELQVSILSLFPNPNAIRLHPYFLIDTKCR